VSCQKSVFDNLVNINNGIYPNIFKHQQYNYFIIFSNIKKSQHQQCNLSQHFPTSTYKIISQHHLTTYVTSSSYYAIEWTFININQFLIWKGLGILEDQYIHSNLIHRVKDIMESHICYCTFKHYKMGQHTR
jgi:hypothetical protein